MWIWMRMMKVSWTERRSNKEVLQMVETGRETRDTLRSRQKRWIDQSFEAWFIFENNVRRTNPREEEVTGD